MTSAVHATVKPLVHVPAQVLAPALVILATIYPAAWTPVKPIRCVAFSVAMIAIVWFGLALCVVIRRWIGERTDEIKADTLAELDAVDELDWQDFMRQLSNPRPPQNWRSM